MAKGKYHKWLTDEGLTLLEGWAREGLSDEQIANNIGIRTSTYYVWLKKHSDISEAIKKGKEVADYEVENAMFKRAIGYEYEETKTYISDSDGKRQKRVEKTVKHIAADTTAQIFWLKNRRPDKWKDKQDIEHSGDVNNQVDLSGLTVEELRNLANSDK